MHDRRVLLEPPAAQGGLHDLCMVLAPCLWHWGLSPGEAAGRFTPGAHPHALLPAALTMVVTAAAVTIGCRRLGISTRVPSTIRSINSAAGLASTARLSSLQSCG